MTSPRKIGILGGTFDPPHLGHLKLAVHFAKLLKLDELLLIPSGEPWKKGSGITPAEIRYQLTEAAGRDLALAFLYLKIPTQISVDRMEIERAGPSYTIDTTKALRGRYGLDVSLIWLMGADSLIELPTWNSWKELLGYVNFAVANRPPHPLEPKLSPEFKEWITVHQSIDASSLEKCLFGRIYLDESLSINLSSTDLRNQLQSAHESVIATDLIPAHVLEIITNLGLYK